MKTFTKEPTEVKDYDIDFTERFSGLGDFDSIASASIVVSTASSGSVNDLVLGPGAHPHNDIVTSTRQKFWVGSGIAGATYQLTMTIISVAARTIVRHVRISVRSP